MPKPTYLVITPVKDEEQYISETIKSVLRQTSTPDQWIIVDDGSTDTTPSVLKHFTSEIDWITVVRTEAKERALGSAEIVAFNRGLELIENRRFDFIVKLDGDLRLDHTYFERLLERMTSNPRWGIASGVYWENVEGSWSPVSMPPYHAAGASKVVRWDCFMEIGGFVSEKGWDTLDEIRAGMRGWKTGHFTDIRFDHLKPEGSAMGSLGTDRFLGEIYYKTGGGPLFLIVKLINRVWTGQSGMRGVLAFLEGYLSSWITGVNRVVSPSEAAFYRSMLWSRVLSGSLKKIPKKLAVLKD